MAAKICDICGAPLGMFQKHKAADGVVCHKCFTAAGYSTGMVCFADTIAVLKINIADRERAGITKSDRELYQETKQKIDANTDPTPHCPKCNSTSISADKKGFGIGKAVAGAAFAGPVGLVAGNLGAKQVRITCLNCGHQWTAGKA